jgi:hypothetical protein
MDDEMILSGVAALVREAADSMSGYPADLPAVARRGAAKRRRHAVRMAGGVAMLAVVALAVPMLIGVTRSPGVTGSPAEPTIGYPQRLLLRNIGGVGVPPSCGTGEVLPDGTLGWLPTPPPLNQEKCIRSVGPDPAVGGQMVEQQQGNDPEDAVALPDGRIVWWVWTDTVTIKYAPSQMSMFLVQAADRSYGPLRDVRNGQPLGADGTSAYVLDGNEVVAYDLGTGQRRTLFQLPASDPTDVLHLSNVDIAGGVLVLVRAGCGLRLLDLRTGRSVASHSLRRAGCRVITPSPLPRFTPPPEMNLGAIRLSPDGKRLAMQYVDGQTPRAAILDAVSGAVLVDAPLPQAGLKAGVEGLTASLAWLQPGAVRIAWQQEPASAKRGQFFPEKDVLRLFTLSVPG